MSLNAQPFLGVPYLRAAWYDEFQRFQGSEHERALIDRLRTWADRVDLKETSAQSAFIVEFFERIWGFWQAGQRSQHEGFTAWPQYALPGAGARGGTGEADLALGWFGLDGVPAMPQVLCEFKDIKGRLDVPQKRKGNDRSPVKQALDYLVAARRGLVGNEPILPLWAIVTDMNEFRLYWHDRAPHQCFRFVVRRKELFDVRSLLDEDEEASFERFLFVRLFHRDTLLSRVGRPALLDRIRAQRFKEQQIEDEFYAQYRTYRERLYNLLRANNAGFAGTPGQLVRIAQNILDRCFFILFCEDMGGALGFPQQLLRDFLSERANSAYFEPSGREVWEGLRRLFRAMDRGGAFGQATLSAFNGGLFRDDSRLDALLLPNNAFCEHLQGSNDASVQGNANLLYFAAAYNFGARSDGSQSLSLYTLGRIFEQSITELEILEAQAEGREALGLVTKRKRDGVYYTPEWVIDIIVEETLGRRLLELRDECGWRPDLPATREVAAIEVYLARVRELAILDPACGSGAFLITAARRLIRELGEVDARLGELGKRRAAADPAKIIREVLTNNLYGVDINGASVEITQLALWLHTARRGEALTVLDDHIQCGNSLIDDRFYEHCDLISYSHAERERVNTFDWHAAFPEVFQRGGFDVVIGNPPYVKLQNFRRVHPDMATYLREGAFHGPPFASTCTGNFDLFLPFIEQGIGLLNEAGRMGFIAPSLWTKNEYGEGLRGFVHAGRHLERWLDFQAFQVFAEAITYTALQFFSRRPNEAVALARAPRGPEDAAQLDWHHPDRRVPYATLDPAAPWLLVPAPERRLIERLAATCRRLDDPVVTEGIIVGLQTSADYVYHLERVVPGSYCCRPSGRGAAPFEAAIEDALMHPLVSGTEAKRYERPRTQTYILFPYEVADGRVRLIPADRMASDYPHAWAYLRRWEAELRRRENGAFDDDRWWRFGRHQNIGKQDRPKLIVPRLVVDLKVSFDRSGEFYLDNVDVGGVLLAPGADGDFVAGVMNGQVSSWIFRRVSKPFQGNFRSANKQFISPLPVPRADAEQQAAVAELARELQALIARRRDREAALRRRVDGVGRRPRPFAWLWPDLADEPEAQAVDIRRRHAELKDRLVPGAGATVELADGELRLLVQGRPVLDRVFVLPDEADLVLAQWRLIARGLSITESTRAERLTRDLRTLIVDGSSAAAAQVVALDAEVVGLEPEIARAEAAMEDLLAELYGLSDVERAIVAAG